MTTGQWEEGKGGVGVESVWDAMRCDAISPDSASTEVDEGLVTTGCRAAGTLLGRGRRHLVPHGGGELLLFAGSQQRVALWGPGGRVWLLSRGCLLHAAAAGRAPRGGSVIEPLETRPIPRATNLHESSSGTDVTFRLHPPWSVGPRSCQFNDGSTAGIHAFQTSHQ